jgi:dUTPase
MELKFKRLHVDAKIPKQGSELAGGWDVTVTEIESGAEDLVICKLGFALEIPKGYKLTLVPRSSLTNTKWVLQNSPGLGDADYVGEYQYRFRAFPDGVEKQLGGAYDSSEYYELTYPQFPYKKGDRIGQIYLEEVIPINFVEVDEIISTDRGSGGFGSTGK